MGNIGVWARDRVACVYSASSREKRIYLIIKERVDIRLRFRACNYTAAPGGLTCRAEPQTLFLHTIDTATRCAECFSFEMQS